MALDSDVRRTLAKARRELLDLTTRNRLLNTSRSRARSSRLEIIDELSSEVFRRLVTDAKGMSFLPRPDSDEIASSDQLLLPQPEEDSERGAARHIDDKLQTALDSEQLQKRLLKLYYDARTFEEEQGVNILYLALGFLKWYEDANSDKERYAPLLLIPVSLTRTNAVTRFRLRYTGDDITTNLSLQARIQADFGLDLPDVPDIDDLDPTGYFRAVRDAVASQERWEVLENDIVLWFFSFAKFLMYRDLESECWPEDVTLEKRPLIQALLGEGFQGDPPLFRDSERLDHVLNPRDTFHVLDADSSQAVVIEEVRRGRNLVIQGPPGTGKSQTIANMIAAAVQAGKTVLFVAEKMAALEVVERRLDNIGLRDMCLELHSHKANKRAVLQDLERTLRLGEPSVADVDGHCEELIECRDRLNEYLRVLHTPVEPCGKTPYQVVGELVRLRAAGVRPPQFTLRSPRTWTDQDFRRRRDLLVDLVRRVEDIGIPKTSPWYGVGLDRVLPTDVDRLMSRLKELEERLERLRNAANELSSLFSIDAPKDVNGVSTVARLARHLALAPRMDRSSIGRQVWDDQRSQIDDLINAGRCLSEARAALEGVVTEEAWDSDWRSTRRALAAHGRSWLRWLYPSYRKAQTKLREFLREEPPRSLSDRLALVDRLMSAQRARSVVRDETSQALGKQAFGKLWAGEDSDWTALAGICEWETQCRESGIDVPFRKILAGLSEIPDLQRPLAAIRRDLKPAVEELRGILKSLRFDLPAGLGSEDVILTPLDRLIEKVRQWLDAPESLSKWVAYNVRRRKLETLGLGELMSEIDSGDTNACEAVARFELAYFEEIIRDVFDRETLLSEFSRSSYEELLERFRKLDARRIEVARQEVAMAHYRRVPTSSSEVGEIGLVRREIEKKRRHLPIRKLLTQAGRAIQAIKPVFMMSPISVAQYLEPGCLEFDLLLIDEASQVQPVDALGAVARARQLVVVGDSKQLPPTRFFSRMLSDEGDTESDQDLRTGDLESILGLCCAQNMPQRMLSWHYRSRHHSLIAVSNHEFYDNRLYVFPSPGDPGPGRGLLFHYIADGVFDRGKSATNRIEARRVAEAVMEHARRRPGQTLGVGAFSVAQRDAILDELELLRRDDPSLEPFFANSSPEPFFVKNLENIQGDERDVIFISVGYGKDSDGYMAMNFGPLSNDGGERRLNVLITRARDCCMVYSSIRAEDIDLNRARARGARALKAFLKYAETGMLDTGTFYRDEHDSEFERQVARAIAAHGYDVHAQVGVAGFFIDLAIVDPDAPGRYLLGVECDGASYHSARWARDRDRLRQAVLEARGWKIHRVWSTDWFQRPESELQRLLEALEEAKAAMANREVASHSPSVRLHVPDRSSIERTECTTVECRTQPGCPTEPYIVAAFRVKTTREIHELPTRELARVVAKIIEIEGPIHREEVARRVTQLWGLQRTGSRIRKAVDQAIRTLTNGAVRVLDGDFLASVRAANCPVRDRSEVAYSSIRKPEMLPPVEIRKAMIAIVQVHVGIRPAEAMVEAARLFGFKSTSSKLRQVMEREIEALVSSRILERRNGKLYFRGEAKERMSGGRAVPSSI